MIRTLALGLTMVLVTLSASAAEPAAGGLKSDKQKFSYAVGVGIGKSFRQQTLDLDPKTFAQGMQDAFADNPLKMSPEEMKASLEAYQKREMDERAAQAKKNIETGKAFLDANKKKDGVVALKSGLQYKVLKDGSGRQPKATDTVEVHYRGTFINGTEFDSSYKRNETATFPVNGVIRGWQEALPLMKEGAKWMIFVPAELAYGERGHGGAIGPNETLIFEIELVSIKNTPAGK